MLCHKFLLMLALSMPIFSAGGSGYPTPPHAESDRSWVPSPAGWAALIAAGTFWKVFSSQRKALKPLFEKIDKAVQEYEEMWEPVVEKFNRISVSALAQSTSTDSGAGVAAAASGGGDDSAAGAASDGGGGSAGAADATPAATRDLTDFTSYARDRGVLKFDKVASLRALKVLMQDLGTRLKSKTAGYYYTMSPIQYFINGKIIQLQQCIHGLQTIEPVLARLAACNGAKVCLQRARLALAANYDSPTRWVLEQGQTLIHANKMLTQHIRQVQEAIEYIESEISRLPRGEQEGREYAALLTGLQDDLRRATHAARVLQQSSEYQLLARQRQSQ